jgi:hypothetical protein
MILAVFAIFVLSAGDPGWDIGGLSGLVTGTVDPLGKVEICGAFVVLPVPLLVPLVPAVVTVSVPKLVLAAGVEVITMVDPSEFVVVMTVTLSVKTLPPVPLPLLPWDEVTTKFSLPTVTLQYFTGGGRCDITLSRIGFSQNASGRICPSCVKLSETGADYRKSVCIHTRIGITNEKTR